MARGGAHFTSQELAEVLSHYDIGTIKEVENLSVGNRRAPKKIISSDHGKFLLKRRPKGKDDIYHVAFAHAVQLYLQEKSFPIAHLVASRQRKSTALHLYDHAYELFHFVDGARYDTSNQAITDAGRQLALFHLYLSEFACTWKPLRGSFHDSSGVRGHLKTIASQRGAGRANPGLWQTAEELMILYNSCSVRVNELGFDSWPEQIVHADWHPGNMLFASHKVTAVLDFDSTRVAPPVTDLANGMLQFSIVAGRPNPAEWPEYLDERKLANFVSGYCEIIPPDDDMVNALPDLMIEAMIAEPVLPIAATGFFGYMSGGDFLRMIHRKCNWIDKNRHLLLKEAMLR
jgi:Ser/Thr protein kinase RdoA (MazF antagonist)